MSTNLRLKKYIGGEFSQADLRVIALGDRSPSESFYFPTTINILQRSLFETGSDSIAFILSTLEPPAFIVWVPDNFCFESLERVQQKLLTKRILVHRYSSIDDIRFSKEWLNILLISYFNRYDEQLSNFATAGENNVITIEDFTHAPFDIKKTKGDFSFCSLRKLVPVSVSVTYARQTPSADFNSNESAYLKIKKAGAEIKQLISEDPTYGEESIYLRLFELAESQLRTPKIQLAHASQIKVFEAIDFDAVLQIRTRNYQSLYHELGPLKFFTSILPGDYMYFMIMTDYQKAMRKHFFEHHIFPAIHWHDSDSAISTKILSFHIDHRYDSSDMKRISEVLEAFGG